MRMAEFIATNGDPVAAWPDDIRKAKYHEDELVTIWVFNGVRTDHINLKMKWNHVMREIREARGWEPPADMNPFDDGTVDTMSPDIYMIGVLERSAKVCREQLKKDDSPDVLELDEVVREIDHSKGGSK